MRKTAINMILFGLLVSFLTLYGYYITSIEFWAVMLIMIGIQINNSLK